MSERSNLLTKPKRLSSAKRKKQILKAAGYLFLKQGYLETSIRQIASRSKVNLATLYYHIGSKEQILSLFLETSTNTLRDYSDTMSEQMKSMPPKEALKLTIKRLLEFVDKHQDTVVFWYQESKNLPSNELINLMKQGLDLAELFKKIFAWGQECGEFQIRDYDIAAHAIITLCDMWCFRRWFFQERYGLEEYTEKLIEFVVNGISGNYGRKNRNGVIVKSPS